MKCTKYIDVYLLSALLWMHYKLSYNTVYYRCDCTDISIRRSSRTLQILNVRQFVIILISAMSASGKRRMDKVQGVKVKHIICWPRLRLWLEHKKRRWGARYLGNDKELMKEKKKSVVANCSTDELGKSSKHMVIYIQGLSWYVAPGSIPIHSKM